MRSLFFIVALLVACTGRAQTPDVAWPREAKGADGTVITVYQPQLERWADNNLSGRAAVSVKRPGEKEPHYGMIELSARTEIDKSADLVTLSSLRITKSNFPGASKEEAEKYLATLRAAVTKQTWPVSAQALQANLAITQARSQKGLPVKNDPPQILFRTAPSMLVLVDGEPQLRAAKGVASAEARHQHHRAHPAGPDLEDALPAGRSAAGGSRRRSPATGGPPPPCRRRWSRRARRWPRSSIRWRARTPRASRRSSRAWCRRLIVATRPTELLQSKGEPQLAPIPGTQLLYMTNSPNDIFLAARRADLLRADLRPLVHREGAHRAVELRGGQVAARGFRQDPAGPPDGRRADLGAGHAAGDARRRSPTRFPQTATVQRDVQPSPVAYDGGEPQWKPIDGTPLSYAPNTAAPVIRVDPKSYYMVQNGVWFSATAPAGPFAVATAVPAVIYSIPPSSPVHYVTYVRVYSSTPTTVFVGYTPGYYGTVMSTDGVVVYGTGYVYPPYVGAYYWYPPPPTYGCGAGLRHRLLLRLRDQRRMEQPLLLWRRRRRVRQPSPPHQYQRRQQLQPLGRQEHLGQRPRRAQPEGDAGRATPPSPRARAATTSTPGATATSTGATTAAMAAVRGQGRGLVQHGPPRRRETVAKPAGRDAQLA